MATIDKRFLVSVFEQVAGMHPDNVAVEHGKRRLSFAALRDGVARLATALRGAGVGRDVVVATCMDSGVEYVAAILAVMKAGGIFMPMDLALPARRIAAALELTTPALVLTAGGSSGAAASPLLARLREAEPVCVGTIDESLVLHLDGGERLPPAPASPPDADDGCYVMFTSGSTGGPKAILGRAKSISHFMHWEAREFELDEHARVSQLTPLTFDASLRDILLPLVTGGRVCIPPPHVRGNAGQLVDWLERSGVTLIHCVPSLFRLLAGEVEARGGGAAVLPRLRHILMAGEALYGKDVLRWMDQVGDRIELVNLYGCSETTLIRTFYRIRGRPASAQSIVPVGKPIANSAVLIVKAGRLCEIGEIGEIYIDTPFASRGYFRDPARTAESFVANPLGAEGTVYRTGDLGRYLPDRAIEFVGRMDTQVKVNGIRIELGEVERAMNGLAAVRQAVVLAIAGADHENRLACYYTEREPIDIGAMRRNLEEVLPAYMIPVFFVRMDALPLTITGKVDRKALPRPEELLYDQASFEPPSDELEERIAAIWRDVLSLRKVGVRNRFMELGGNSLRAITVISRMFRELGVELTVAAFFENATVRELAAVVRRATAQGGYQPVPRVARGEPHQLSHAQRRLWILGQLAGGLTAYNNTHAVLIEGALDREALHQAFAALVARHESLRTVFAGDDGEPVQLVLPRLPLSLVEADFTGEPDPDAALRERMTLAAATIFDLGRGPLIQVQLLRMPAAVAERHALLFTIHHIVSDGWSMGVLQRELSTLYRSLRAGEPASLPPLEIHYVDFCAWERARLESGRALRDYWLRQLSGEIRGLDLPTDRKRPPVFSFAGRTVRFALEARLASQLRALATSADASLFMVLVAAVKVLLHRYTGRCDLLLGTPTAGRDHPDLEDQVGFYASTLVLRDQLDPARSFLATLAGVRRTCLEAYQHQSYPFDLLLAELDIERDPSRNPVFDVMIVLQEEGGGGPDLAGLTLQELEVPVEHSRFDLTFNFHERAAELHLDLNYNTSLFDRGRIEHMVGHLTQLCESLLLDPGRPIGRLDLLGSGERQRLEQLSHAAPAAAQERTLAELFAAQARRTPERIAIIRGEHRFSYGWLSARARELAAALCRDHGVRRGDIVGASFGRSEWGIVALLGVLEAQAVYLPVDPAYPAERARLLLLDSGCRTVLIDAEEPPAWSGAAEIAAFVTVDARSPDCGPAAAPVERSADDLAYIIYTSGSTGTPKGVMVTHRGFVNMITAQRAAFEVSERDRVLQFFSMSFDGSLSEVFMALLGGAALVLVDTATILEPRRFEEHLRRHEVTVATLSPSYLHRLDAEALGGLRTLITAGEAAVAADSRRHARLRRTFNAYGPTEASVCASLHQVTTDDRGAADFIPIGRPLAGTAIHVLDADLQPVPIGCTGEICISGIGLAVGYLGRPQLTAEQFVPHPFRAGLRIYRTGDLGCWLADGNLRYLGRIDQQVKVAGHRIEPGEVEHWLQRYPGVREAAVIARAAGSGGAQLAGGVAGVPSADLPAVRAWLRRRLPEFMVPALLVAVDSLPLLPSGKVDRSALGYLIDQAGASGAPATAATEIERRLLAIWGEVLGRSGLDVLDDFFACGGHSLAAIEILASVRRQLGVSVPLLDLYRSPTVRELARRLGPQADVDNQRPCVHFRRGAPASVFCFPPLADQHAVIYAALARELEGWHVCGLLFTGGNDSAAAHADLILELQPEGPYFLLGYSAGGNLAFAAAQELERRGAAVAALVLLDTGFRDHGQPFGDGEREAATLEQLDRARRAASADPVAERQLRAHLGAYLDHLAGSCDARVIDADIHVLRAEGGLPEDKAERWRAATRGSFAQAPGSGTHFELLEGEHLAENAGWIGAILGGARAQRSAPEVGSVIETMTSRLPS